MAEGGIIEPTLIGGKEGEEVFIPASVGQVEEAIRVLEASLRYDWDSEHIDDIEKALGLLRSTRFKRVR